jgi:hypothetical protein
MDDPAPVTTDSKENLPLKIPEFSKRSKRTFIKKKYAKVLVIREVSKDRTGPRITEIPESLDAAKARMRIVVTKLMDRLERKLNVLEDCDAQLTSKEYKEIVESIDKCGVMMDRAYGSEEKPAKNAPVPVNNGIIINGSHQETVSRLMGQIANAVSRPTEKAVDSLILDDAGTNQSNS